MTNSRGIQVDVDPDFFRDEECDYEKGRTSGTHCPWHERNWNALTRRYFFLAEAAIVRLRHSRSGRC